ncbi:MAG: hypothetical protein ABI557_09505, partial [Aureliella sp.]
MTEMSDPQSTQPSRLLYRALAWIAWLAVVGCMVAIVVIRTTAHTSDFALANAMTALLILATWLILTLALALSRLPRSWWRVALLTPIGVLALFLSVYKFQRFNGEMTPQFAWRWSSSDVGLANVAELGTSRASSSTTTDSITDSTTANLVEGAIAPELLAPRASDFPQYLGKNRDATLPHRAAFLRDYDLA